MEESASAEAAALGLRSVLIYLTSADFEPRDEALELIVVIQHVRSRMVTLADEDLAQIAEHIWDLQNAIFDPDRTPGESLEASLEQARALDSALLEIIGTPATRRVERRQNDAAYSALQERPAERHATDASSMEKLMRTILALALLFTAGTAAVGVWISLMPPASLIGVGIAAGSLGVAASVLGWSAHRLNLESQELRRVSRQLQMLPEFVQQMPINTQGLLRGSLVQRLFPRLLSDTDPLRETPWAPNTDDLLVTLDADYLSTAREGNAELVE